MKSVNFVAVKKLVLRKSSKLENEDELSQVFNRKVRRMIKRAREAYLTHDWNKLIMLWSWVEGWDSGSTNNISKWMYIPSFMQGY